VLINVLSQPTYYSRFREEQKTLLNESKAICNNVGKKFGELKKVIISIANGKNFNELHRDRLLEEIETLLVTVPDTDELWRGLDPEHYNENFENLLTGMRTAALRWQKLLVRAQNLEISNLKNKIKGVNTRSEEYVILENILITKQDNKRREQLLDSKLSEVLGSEKPSRHFLDIAKVTSSDESLTVIKKGDGSNFENVSDQQAFIKNFYENLYKLDATEGTIEDFLGAEICNSELVKNSKLTDPESTELDAELTIEELDESLSKANFKSACGTDKLSNNFIKKFWHIIRLPLFTVAKRGLEINNLPDFFLTADIKLIPKKGDLTQIQNWRPISLLSNLYKIISRAINIRLKKVAPRILSRAQKGFCPNKYMHEVIINSLERIKYCNEN
jgi:Reverse transcriptase (RNA-dependent DNA polymerase)